MNSIYNATVNAVKQYTHNHTKHYTVLDATVIEASEETDITPTEVTETSEETVIAPTEVTEVSPDDTATSDVVVIDSENLEEINPKDMKKSDLIDYVKMLHGDDADVSGTKAEILERYFN